MKKLVILVTIICASILAGILIPKKSISVILENSGYYFIFVSFFLWVTCAFNLYYGHIKAIFLEHYDGLLLSILLMILIFCIAPPKFKILNDETNLIGVSMSMFQSKKTSLPNQGFNLDYRRPEYKNLIVDKRPLLYPLLVSFVHSLRGYSANNGFVVNFIVGILALFTFYLFISNHFPRIYALISLLIIASLPNFVMWTTSSGFETLNLFFIICTLYLFNRVIVTRNIQKTELFFITLVLTSQCRYESAIFTLAFLFLLPMLLKKESIESFSIITYLTPVLFIPIIWLTRLYANQPLVNKVPSGVAQVPNLFEAFSFSNLISNSATNLIVFLGLDPHLGFSWIISAISLVGFYLMTKRLIVDRQNTSLQSRTMWLYGVATFCLLYFIQVSFYLGNMTLYTQNRFAMAYLPFMVFPAIFFVQRILHNANNLKKIIVLIFFVFHLLYFWPYGSQQLLVHTGSIPYEYNKTLRYLKDNFNRKSNIMIISERPNLYIVHYKGAVDFTYANQNLESIKDHYGKEYDHILVLQKYLYKTQTPLKTSRLDTSYRLAHLKTLNLTQAEYLKISKLKLDNES
jgi:hypothetical protein